MKFTKTVERSEIPPQAGSFEYYLKENGLSQRTISDHLKNIEHFASWRKENDFTPLPLGGAGGGLYNELLSYVQYQKNNSISVPTINIRLGSIRKYFEHIKEEGIIENNPARRLHIKGAVKKIITNPLSYAELEQLYNEYAKPKEHYREEKSRKAHQRNIIILGLMIWQGIHSGELGKIEIPHVKLNEGQIYIPGTGRSNGRELKLESRQIITLHRYISETKFTSENLVECVTHDVIQHIAGEIKGINPVIKNAQHIRASVILHWLRMYDKRTVQYLLGHKWISSTEHYQIQELTGLTDLLTKHHPFS